MFTIINNTGVYFTEKQKRAIKKQSLECGILCVMLIQDQSEPNIFDVLENGNDEALLFTFDRAKNCIIAELSEGCY